ncbi:MAG: alpha/beta hydrolase, partial [Aeromicrobium sp.]|nr:alpha/beta hydrolase [Aeromicrobium sp.]
MITLMAAGALAACSSGGDRRPTEPTQEDDVETIAYGPDPAQIVELSRPTGTSKGVVVVIHGGF